MADSPAYKFIKRLMKYSAHKYYVGTFSGRLVNDLWKLITETEFTGNGYWIRCGNITYNSLRGAFVREMSYNPLRYKLSDEFMSLRRQPEINILKQINQILQRFTTLWPNGIGDGVKINDIASHEYRFFRDLRDCFKTIAYQNMADFNKSVYRDEIIASIAANQNLYMASDIRVELMLRMVASAENRARHRKVLNICSKIDSLEKEMQLNIHHDRNYTSEIKDELNTLKAELDVLQNAANVRKSQKTARNSQPAVVADANKVNAAAHFTMGVEDAYTDDAYDREQELINTLTPEHSMGLTPDVFVEYLSQHREHSL